MAILLPLYFLRGHNFPFSLESPLSTHPPIRLSIHPYIHRRTYLPTYLSYLIVPTYSTLPYLICLSLSIYLPTYLPVYLSIYLSIYVPTYLPT